MSNTTLYNEMEKHYVDADGNVIAEAVDLGILIMRFFSGYHDAKAKIFSVDPSKGTYVDDYVMSVVSESMGLDAFNENRNKLNAQLAVLEGYDESTANCLRNWTYGVVLDILMNKMYQHPMCNVAMHLFITEGVMRTFNAYLFADKGKEDRYISYANFQCAYHALSFIALVCNQDMSNYVSMNIEVEKAQHELSKRLLND